MGKPEAKIENYLVKQAKEHNIWESKFNPCGKNGIPDRVLIGYGLTVFVETKRNGGTPRELQKRVIKHMREHGGIVFTANTKKQVDDIIEFMINNKRKYEVQTDDI